MFFEIEKGDEGSNLLVSLFPCQTIKHAIEMKIFSNGQTPEKVGIPARNVDPLSDPVTIPKAVDAQNLNLSPIGEEQSGEDGEERGLPGSVRTQDAKDINLLDMEVDPLKNQLLIFPPPSRSEGLVDSLCLDRKCHNRL